MHFLSAFEPRWHLFLLQNIPSIQSLDFFGAVRVNNAFKLKISLEFTKNLFSLTYVTTFRYDSISTTNFTRRIVGLCPCSCFATAHKTRIVLDCFWTGSTASFSFTDYFSTTTFFPARCKQTLENHREKYFLFSIITKFI